MDQWLAAAIPPQQPGESLRYDPWGRLVGQSLGSTITAPSPPDTTLTRCEYLWARADQLQSTNLGTLKEYVDQHLPIDITLSFSANQVKGGTPVTGIVTLSRPRFGGGVGLFLVSDNSTLASVPDGFTIPAGVSSGTFPITTHSATATTIVGIVADFADLNPPVAGNPGEASLTVTP